MKTVQILGGILGTIVVVMVVVFVVMPMLTGPHFGFPSSSQVDSATGTSNYTASRVITTVSTSSSVSQPGAPPGAVKMEGIYFNNSAGSLEFVVMEFKSTSSSNKEFLNLSKIFSPIISVSGGSMKNSTYRGASIVVLEVLGHSGISYGKIGNYVFAVIYIQHSSLTTGYLTASTTVSLIHLQVNAMVS